MIKIDWQALRLRVSQWLIKRQLLNHQLDLSSKLKLMNR